MRLPLWLREKSARDQHGTKRILRGHGLSTVCEEARCPNRGRCFAKPTAAFLILGDVCTRRCSFCSVRGGVPCPPDQGEPPRVAFAAREMGLRYVVITSVTRDDLHDGGAGHFALTVSELRSRLPGARVEVLIPDFKGDHEALATVLDSQPDVLNHNIETVPRLYAEVRPQACYRRSLELLMQSSARSAAPLTKSGIMVGLGETFDEVVAVMHDLREVGCQMLTIGQYLQPRRSCIPVREYVHPELFIQYRQKAQDVGFRSVAAGPLVRSSMNASDLFSSLVGDAGEEP